MKPVVAVLVVCSSLAAWSCSAPQPPQFGQQEATRIRERTRDYARAFNEQDADKVAAFYPGEGVFMPPNAATVRGRDAIRDFYKLLYAEGATNLTIASKDVGGSGTLAYESGTFGLDRHPASDTASHDRGKYLFVWRYYPMQKAWLIDYTIWSSDLPQPLPLTP